MSYTIAEKILSRAAGKDKVKPGDIITAKIDLAMSHIATARIAVNFGNIRPKSLRKVWNPQKIIVILDHFSPAPSSQWALAHKLIRDFVKEQNLIFYDIKEGICHQVLPEKGHVKPGMLIVGTDSHTTTYGAFNAAATGIGYTEMTLVFYKGELWFRVPESIKFEIKGKLSKYVMAKDVILSIAGKYGAGIATYKSVEFVGETMNRMSIDSRMTISNMALEIGAKFSFTPPDEKIIQWLKDKTDSPLTLVQPDDDAHYTQIFIEDVSDLEPQIACPHTVDNVKSVHELKEITIDQAFIGSCTNGRIEDFKIAAEILKGRQIHRNVRLICIPASQKIWLELAHTGLADIIIESGGIICNPNCGPCFGAHMGMLAPGEVCISSSNRNFQGRMGAETSQIYLASPAVVAASAITGVISDPREI